MLTAFVIEDDPNFSAALVEMVRRYGFEVKAARDGLTALEMLKGLPPDLILLDIHLPFAKGEQILDALEGDNRFEKTRVALMTADLTTAAALAPRVELVLEKPFLLAQLKAWLNSF